MRSRPIIELKLPSAVLPGDDVTITVVLDSSSVTPVEYVDITLKCNQVARLPNESNVSVFRTIYKASSRLREGISLPEGSITMTGNLSVPVDMPISYIGYASEVHYVVEAHVAIPWWPDARETRDLLVAPRPGPRPAKLPLSATTEQADRPFVEVALDDRSFAPGEELTGVVALGNVRGRRVSGIDVSLVGTEHLRISSPRAVEAHRHTVFIRAEEADEGREMGFRLRVPRNTTPSFDAGLMALMWGLEVRVELGLASTIVHMLPVVIGAFARPPGERPADAVRQVELRPRAASASNRGSGRPRVGSERWRDAWAEAGAGAGLTLDPEELRLTGRIQGYEATIALDHTGETRAVIAELRWPSWGIELYIEPGGLPQLLFTVEDSFGRYRVRGRDAAQVKAAVTPTLRSALLTFDSVQMNDDRVRVSERGASHDGAWLGSLLNRVNVVASAVREAASRMPPPSSMASMLPEWRSFAGELGGRLDVGSMSIREGRLEGGVFEIETCFDAGHSVRPDGAPLPSRTRVTLSLDPPLPKPFDLKSSTDLAAAPIGTLAIVGLLLERTRELRVLEVGIEIDVPAPLERPSTLREVMRAMLALAQRLRGEGRGGPYR